MNTATRVIGAAGIRPMSKSTWVLSAKSIGFLCLIFAILFSAFGVIYLKDLNRRLFIQYQESQQMQQQYQTDWGKLLLEQSTWSTQARIQQIAAEHLNMVMPGGKNLKMIKN